MNGEACRREEIMRQMFFAFLVLVMACSETRLPSEAPGAPDSAGTPEPPPVATIAIFATRTAVVGTAVQVTVVVRDAERNVLSGRPVVISSSDERVLSAYANGVVWAVAVGEAKLTATSGDKVAQITITVVEASDACYGCWDY